MTVQLKKDSKLQRPLWEKRIAKVQWFVDTETVPTDDEYKRMATWLNDRAGGWTPKVWAWRTDIYDALVILEKRMRLARLAEKQSPPTV